MEMFQDKIKNMNNLSHRTGSEVVGGNSAISQPREREDAGRMLMRGGAGRVWSNTACTGYQLQTTPFYTLIVICCNTVTQTNILKIIMSHSQMTGSVMVYCGGFY